MTYSFKAARLAALAPVVFLGMVACQSDATSPITRAASSNAAHLVAPGEAVVMLVDTTDANGTTTMIAEYAAGVLPATGDTPGGSIGSVTIQTIIPGFASSSKACISSSIVSVDVTPGWTSGVKKSGGCNKDIGVQFENKATKKRADFSFLMEPGKTRIDAGAVR